MAYENRFVSIRPVIESVYRDSGIDDINLETAVEDAGELIGLLGIPYTYVDKTTDGVLAPFVEVSDYRALLPDDLVYLTSISKANLDQTGKIVSLDDMIETSSLLQYSKINNAQDVNYIQPTANFPINSVDENGQLTSLDGQVTGEAAISIKTVTHSYKLNNNIIYTDFQDGYLCIFYKAYPLDEEGYPLIPDDEKFRKALEYHLMYKIDFRRWRAFPEKPGLRALLNDSEQRRDFYVGAARNKAHIPTVDKMEAIKNRHLSMIPRVNEHKNGFNTLNNLPRRKF